MDEASLPLSGITVLDLTSVVFGPYGTQILADLGARVIKVESPQGDSTRQIGPAPEAGMGGLYMNLNRGKKGIALNLKLDSHREALLRLCETADVFVHSMRPSAIDGLQLTYDKVAARRRNIVYCNCWGFGNTGPLADKAAYDDIIQAVSGLVMLNEETVGESFYTPTALADKIAGLTLAYSVLAALLRRVRDGAGMELEIPMFEAMSSFMLAEHLSGALFDPPLGRAVYERQTARSRRPFRTSDGLISVIIYNDKQWRHFLDLIDRSELKTDPKFSSMPGRLSHLQYVNQFLADEFRQRTTQAWLSLLDEADIPAAPLCSTNDLMEHAHLNEVGFFHVSDDRDLGRLRHPRLPLQIDGRLVPVRSRAPRLGEHTEEVLSTAGFSDEEIGALIRDTTQL